MDLDDSTSNYPEKLDDYICSKDGTKWIQKFPQSNMLTWSNALPVAKLKFRSIR